MLHYGELVPWNPYSQKACTVLLSIFHSVMHVSYRPVNMPKNPHGQLPIHVCTLKKEGYKSF